ncbi:MAG: recombinase family protein [Synergistaceae bacterium]|nr:recombinase family protein [Synergistaceae bacterium]
MAKVTIIEPVIQRLIVDSDTLQPRKLRVAAYARVSTEQDEQQNSYEAQVNYYTSYIKANDQWEFAGIYSDEGITGTNTKRREGFNRMMAAALNGEIDLILTKSISRFARNTVDTLQAIRELKEKGVEVRFENDHINTMDPRCELTLTIMSSLAQEESRSISENVRWGKQRSMQSGRVSMSYKNFLGYRRGPDGKPEIDEEEAKIVRQIYDLFLEGKTLNYIANLLTSNGVKTPGGKNKWSVETVKRILSNEKYKGDALLQKTIVVDYLTKKVKKNEGDARQFYISNSHPAIIEPDRFDLVQVELARRCTYRSQLSNNSPFTSRIICGDCGGFFGHKVFHGKDKYRVDVWYCNHRYEGDVCETPILREDQIKNAFLEALSQILRQKDAYITAYNIELTQNKAKSHLEQARSQAEDALQTAISELTDYITQNTKVRQDQAAYNKHYQLLREVVDQRKAELEAAKRAITDNTARREKLRRFITAIGAIEVEPPKYSDNLFIMTVENITVLKRNDDKVDLKFLFTDGTEITVPVSIIKAA